MFLKIKPNKNSTNNGIYDSNRLNSNRNFDSKQLDEIEDDAFLIFTPESDPF